MLINLILFYLFQTSYSVNKRFVLILLFNLTVVGILLVALRNVVQSLLHTVCCFLGGRGQCTFNKEGFFEVSLFNEKKPIMHKHYSSIISIVLLMLNDIFCDQSQRSVRVPLNIHQLLVATLKVAEVNLYTML